MTDEDKQSELFEEFLALIAVQTGTQRNKLNTDTVIQSLGVDGDDACELLEELKRSFNINLDGFEYFDYFHDESWLVTSFLNIALYMTPEGRLNMANNRKTKKDLTVMELFKRIDPRSGQPN
ncbi:MAG TPA: DUF1493 family protein [Candidatus Melainabacteria bacterium]|nr:DUF1493 family protein [Candidatus Melainabacteria bacterium]